MSNAIVYALNHVRNFIPPEILNKVFISNINHNNLIPVDVNSIIKEKVIANMVLPAMNLVNGIQERINLSNLTPMYSDMTSMVIQVPMNLTQGKSIMSALSVEYGNSVFGTSLSYPDYNVNQLQGAAKVLLDSQNGVSISSTSNVSIVGENTILIREGIRWVGNLILVCYLENDTEMNSLPPRAIITFAEIVELAVKAYIYNQTVVLMDRAQIYAGHELGAFREQIYNWSDAGQQFMEKIKTDWSKSMYLADDYTRRNIVRLNFPKLI